VTKSLKAGDAGIICRTEIHYMTGDTFCSHTTTMSNIPMPENLLKHIENLFIVLLQEIEAYSKLSKASPVLVKQLITKFNNNPLIALLTATPLT
jgi:hypothetical protein